MIEKGNGWARQAGKKNSAFLPRHIPRPLPNQSHVFQADRLRRPSDRSGRRVVGFFSFALNYGFGGLTADLSCDNVLSVNPGLLYPMAIDQPHKQKTPSLVCQCIPVRDLSR